MNSGVSPEENRIEGYYLEWTVSKIDLRELTLMIFFSRKRQFWFKIIATVIHFMEGTWNPLPDFICPTKVDGDMITFKS